MSSPISSNSAPTVKSPERISLGAGSNAGQGFAFVERDNGVKGVDDGLLAHFLPIRRSFGDLSRRRGSPGHG